MHHHRRRLLLNDDANTAPDEDDRRAEVLSGQPDDADPARPSYTPSFEAARRRAVHDLLPQRYWTLALAIAIGLAGIAVLEVLHAWSPWLAEALSPEAASAFDLGSSKNVGHSFAALFLGLTSVTGLLVYGLRRHRIDDYHGRYRVWLWMVIVCASAALAETAGLVGLLLALVHRVATPGDLTERILLPAVAVGLVAVLGIRLLIEIRRSRLALSIATLASAAFLISMALGRDWPLALPEGTRPMVVRGSWLSGYVLAWGATLSYHRFLLLEAAGATVRSLRGRRRARKGDDSTDNSEAQSPNMVRKPTLKVRTDLDHIEPQSANSGPRLHLQNARTPAVAPATNESQETRILSRADRRRLRKEARLAG